MDIVLIGKKYMSFVVPGEKEKRFCYLPFEPSRCIKASFTSLKAYLIPLQQRVLERKF